MKFKKTSLEGLTGREPNGKDRINELEALVQKTSRQQKMGKSLKITTADEKTLG